MKAMANIIIIASAISIPGCYRGEAERPIGGTDRAILIRHEWPGTFILQYEMHSGRSALIAVRLLGVDVRGDNEQEGISPPPIDYTELYGSSVEIRHLTIYGNVNKAQIMIYRVGEPTAIEINGVLTDETQERPIMFDPAIDFIINGSGILVKSELDAMPLVQADLYRSMERESQR